MRRLLNVLAAVLLLLLLVARRRFQVAFDQKDRGERPNYDALRALIGPASMLLATFVALAMWMLIGAGYTMPAILLAVHLGFLLETARRRTRSTRTR